MKDLILFFLQFIGWFYSIKIFGIVAMGDLIHSASIVAGLILLLRSSKKINQNMYIAAGAILIAFGVGYFSVLLSWGDK
ncbi:hypothetical protein [Baaleninema simplex]|uniref:hypothetical protein n=1 Tax=Baaleninema simplex TaxID=2862350 RepID=UPI000376DDE3|nr:hypothetical protein [Baaleninema simplex]